MKITTGDNLNKMRFAGMGYMLKAAGFKAGDELWATAYSLNSPKDTKALKCTPVKGVLSMSNKMIELSDKDYCPEYFIPYGKNGKPVFSRAVNVASRVYATTQEEAVDLYNDAVTQIVNMFTSLRDEACADYI